MPLSLDRPTRWRFRDSLAEFQGDAKRLGGWHHDTILCAADAPDATRGKRACRGIERARAQGERGHELIATTRLWRGIAKLARQCLGRHYIKACQAHRQGASAIAAAGRIVAEHALE